MKIDFTSIYLFTWEELYSIEIWNELGIEAFRKLCENQERSLETVEAEFKKMVSAELANMDEEDKGSYYMQNLKRDDMMIGELVRLQRYSLCQSIFSFFEGRMKAVCEQVSQKFNLKIPKKNKEGDLVRYWDFLVKVFVIDHKNLDHLFEEIKGQKLTRNIITHSEGIPEASKESNIVLMPGLKLEKYGSFSQLIIADVTYISILLDKIFEFLKELLLAIDQRYIALLKSGKV